MIHSKLLLKSRGLSTTRQRAAILKTMRMRHDHLDAEGVYMLLRRKMPSLSLDTVYRTLNRLAQEGLIQKLALPTHRFHFDGDLRSRDHFLCTACEKITDVELSEDASGAVPQSLDGIGHVQTLQRVFLGTCTACAARAAKTPPNAGQCRGKGGRPRSHPRGKAEK